jgi:signal transduction histidine kinase
MGAPRGGTFRSMTSLVQRARALDRRTADAIVALLFLGEALAELAFAVPPGVPHHWLVAGALVVEATALGLRRRVPLTATALGWCAYLAINIAPTGYVDHMVSPLFAMVFLVWSAGRHCDDRRAITALVLGTVMISASTALDHYNDGATDSISTIAFAVWAPLLVGRFMRHRARLHESLREKAAQLAAQRASRSEAAAAEERTRIAGELHDVVAHALSAMVVQASGARRLAGRDPAQASTAFQAVEDTGREALTEIRTLLGVLRHADEEIALAPQPSLRHVGSLVARARAAGLPVDLAVEGDALALPAGVDLTGYRVIQAALRSAAEQGAAGHASVRLRYAGDHVDLRVEDDGAAPGRELPGVRERVSFYGGQLRAGARREGGHSVRARLPVEAA